MFRTLLLVLVMMCLVFGPVGGDAKGRKGSRNKQQLVNRVLVGAGWDVGSISVINRSSYDQASVEYAARLWSSTSAPRLLVRHEQPTPCSNVKPIRNVIILCDGAPWIGPSTNSVAGFTANYTQTRKQRARSSGVSIQASVIWLYQPRWSNSKILHYIPSHELGHALGLDEMNCTCVMTPLVSDIDVLGSAEQAALNAIYAKTG